MTLPQISVITPSYNQAQFLERALRSVLEQDYPNVEFIVMDGGSTDGSADIIRRYANRIDFWQSKADGGQTAAINAGWRRARGDILCWLNSDDYFLPGALAAAATAFADYPQTLLVYGRMERVGPNGESMGMIGERYRWRTLLLSHQIIPQPSSFVRREAVERAGFLDESLQYSMDYDFFLRVAPLAPPVWIDRVLSAATVHPEAKTTRDRLPAKGETYRVRRRYARGLSAVVVRAQPAMSSAFQRLPPPARSVINWLRPKQVRP